LDNRGATEYAERSRALIGLAVEVDLTRLLESMLFGVQASDLIAFGGAAGMLLLTALRAE